MMHRLFPFLLSAVCAAQTLPTWPRVPMGPVRQTALTYRSAAAEAAKRPAVAAALRDQPLRHADATGRVRFAGGLHVAKGAGTAEEAAGRFATDQGDGGLRAVRTDELGPLRFVRMERVVDGVPVHDSETVVGMTADNVVFSYAAAGIVSTETGGDWRLTGDDAAGAAIAPRNIHPIETPRSERVWFDREGRLRAAWRVRAATVKPPGDWEIVVDAATGAVLDAFNGWQAAEGFVFPRNPVLDRSTQRVTLDNLQPGPTLSGRFASVTSAYEAVTGQSSTLSQLARADVQGNFLFGLDDPRFEEVQLYYGIDAAHTRFRALGFDRLDRPVDGVVYWPEAFEVGPFFLGSAFQGRGGIFFAPVPPRFFDPTWDTDVIFHEYTHAVVAAAVGATRSRGFGALNEAYADYFSSSFQNDPNVGEFSGPVFGAITPYLRTIENPNIYPRDLFNEIHQASLIWSAALWDIRRALGPAQADRIAMASLLSLRGDSDFVPAGIAAVSAASTLFGSTARAVVLDIMARRGILSSEGSAAFNALDLTAGVPLPGRAPAAAPDACILEDQRQFRITVTPGATQLGLVLNGLRDLRLFARYRRPVTLDAGRIVADFEADSSPLGGLITLSSSPELQAGSYYLAVLNCNTTIVDYQIGALVEGATPDGGPLIANIPPGLAVSGNVPPGPLLNSRQFAIQVPANATSLRVSVTATANVDLFAQFGRPIALTDMGLPAGDAMSVSPDNNETLTISALTTPNLRAGTWYFAIYNRDEARTARYSITAITNAGAADQTRISSLAAGAPVEAPMPAASGGMGVLAAQQFAITIPATAQRLTITASSRSDALVMIRLRNTVNVENGRAVYDYAFQPARSQTFEITRASLPPLQVATVYYIAIANFSPAAGTISLTWRFSADQGSPPMIAAGGVVNGASFTSPICAACWITITGVNLANNTRSWELPDFDGVRLPTRLDGTSVTINGRPAYVAFISPGQINALAPDDAVEGTVEVRVTNAAGQSSTTSVIKSRIAPAMFTFSGPNQARYAAAVHPDGTYVGPAGLFGAGVSTRAARPGERVLLYGTGFGPVAGPPPAAEAFVGAARLLTNGRVRIGGVEAVVEFAGLVLNGLYQFNVVVPQLPPGDTPVTITVDGVETQRGVLLSIER